MYALCKVAILPGQNGCMYKQTYMKVIGVSLFEGCGGP